MSEIFGQSRHAPPDQHRQIWSNFGLGCALLVSKTDGRRRVAQAIVATVIHYCGLLFEQPSELRYARLIGHVDLKWRDRDAPPVKHGKIGGFRRLHGTPGSIGDPIVGFASAVLARIDLRPLLAAAPLGGYHDAFDLFRWTIGKIDIDKHVALHLQQRCGE